jgi:hypothetical protein
MSPPLSLMQYSSSNLSHSQEQTNDLFNYSSTFAASPEQPEKKKKRVRTID